MRGTVVSFENVKGYGFIAKGDGSGDIFFHHTAINMRGFRTLSKGQEVEFDVEISERNKKPMATDVRPIGGSNGSRTDSARGK